MQNALRLRFLLYRMLFYQTKHGQKDGGGMQKSLEEFIRELNPRLLGRESAGKVRVYKGVLAGEMRINRIASIGNKKYLIRFGKNVSKAKNLSLLVKSI